MLAFQDVRLINVRYAGIFGSYSLDNLKSVLTSPDFRQSLENTLVYTVFGTILSIGIGLIAALIVRRPFRGRALVRGVMLLSGLYDLRPLVPEPANEWLHLDAERAARYSPTLLALPSIAAPVMVAVGGAEPEAFRAQSRDYAAHIGRTHDEIAGLDHMTMIGALRSPREGLGAIMAGWLAV